MLLLSPELRVTVAPLVMRTPYDQFAKQLLVEALSGVARIETDAEVTADVQHADVFCVPDPLRESERKALGLLGEMIATPCLFEPFHRTPQTGEILECVRKQLTTRQMLIVRARKEGRDASSDPPPMLWVIASGRPDGAIRSLQMSPLASSACGFYGAAEGFKLGVVVASELERTRGTLFLRLMGAGRVLSNALADLRALSLDAWERRAAAPAVIHLRLTIPMDHELRSPEDQELEMSTSELYEAWKQRVHDEGLQEGRREGLVALRRAITTFYEARFGAMPSNVRSALDGTADAATLTAWSIDVATQAKDDIDRKLLGRNS